MQRPLLRLIVPAVFWLAGCSAVTSTTAPLGSTTPTAAPTIPSLQQYADPSGTVATYIAAGSIDESNHFFEPLGSNGRTCATCHQFGQGMSIRAASAAALFSSSAGTDPLFAAIDGANCPTAATGDASAHSLMISKGLVRIAVTLPAAAEFKMIVVSDPYGCAITASGTQQTFSVYRRPLASTAVAYLSNVMWDTRETISPAQFRRHVLRRADRRSYAATSGRRIHPPAGHGHADRRADCRNSGAAARHLHRAGNRLGGWLALCCRGQRRSGQPRGSGLLSRHQRRLWWRSDGRGLQPGGLRPVRCLDQFGQCPPSQHCTRPGHLQQGTDDY